MAVGWIDDIYNNTERRWELQSIDTSHNGVVKGGGQEFALDDGKFHALQAGTHYDTEWCGIPWYFQGKHYKVFRSDGTKTVQFYTSQLDGKNWIMFEDGSNGRRLGRSEAPKQIDFHCNLRLEADGVFIDQVNDDGSSADVQHQIFNEAGVWIPVAAAVLAAILL